MCARVARVLRELPSRARSARARCVCGARVVRLCARRRLCVLRARVLRARRACVRSLARGVFVVARARLARAPRLCAVSRPRRFGCRDALSAADSHLFVSFNHSKEERFVLVVMVHKPKNTG